MTLEWILDKFAVNWIELAEKMSSGEVLGCVWTGFIWVRIGTSGGVL